MQPVTLTPPPPQATRMQPVTLTPPPPQATGVFLDDLMGAVSEADHSWASQSLVGGNCSRAEAAAEAAAEVRSSGVVE